MAQILCFGASSVYGVGTAHGSWADLLKADLHSRMYGEKNGGEQHEIYNLGVPGANIQDLLARFKSEVATRAKTGREIVLIITIGTTDSRAKDEPGNFVSSTEIFKDSARLLFNKAQEFTDKIICLGHTPVDDARTNPIRSSYFSSERIKLFENALGEACQEKNVLFVPLFDNAKQLNWNTDYLYGDGLHMNDKGHQWILEQIRQTLADMIGV
jgi:lysophospholipase L1-like esterase